MESDVTQSIKWGFLLSSLLLSACASPPKESGVVEEESRSVELPALRSDSSYCADSIEPRSPKVARIKEVDDLTKIHQKGKEARRYALEHGMNLRFCFLLDFSYDLYTRRFFVYDLLDSRVMETALVSHGHGEGNTESRVLFSNVIGSNCSSLGKYRVGERAYSQRGVHFHYKLYGLESTNSNAFQRSVVLHSFEYFGCDSPCLVSEGCAIVCDDMMLYLDELLKSEKKPTLLWIFQ